MGFRISWVGFEGVGKAEVLNRLGFKDSGVVDEVNEAPFSIAELPTGWTIVFSNDFEFGQPETLIGFAGDVELVSCQIHEGIMVSAVHFVARHAELRSVWHDAEAGIYDVQVSGQPPGELAAVVLRLHAEQDANGGEAGHVDYSFDIPVELAEGRTGYRHDRWCFDWGQPSFTVIERA